MKKISEEDFETQCKLLCDFCAQGYPICDCKSCITEKDAIVHLSNNFLWTPECKASKLRKLWQDTNNS